MKTLWVSDRSGPDRRPSHVVSNPPRIAAWTRPRHFVPGPMSTDAPGIPNSVCWSLTHSQVVGSLVVLFWPSLNRGCKHTECDWPENQGDHSPTLMDSSSPWHLVLSGTSSGQASGFDLARTDTEHARLVSTLCDTWYRKYALYATR